MVPRLTVAEAPPYTPYAALDTGCQYGATACDPRSCEDAGGTLVLLDIHLPRCRGPKQRSARRGLLPPPPWCPTVVVPRLSAAEMPVLVLYTGACLALLSWCRGIRPRR